MKLAASHRSIVAICVVVAASCLPPECAAFWISSTTHNVDTTKTVRLMARCDQFKLKEAQGGAAAATRIYWFTGVCTIWKVHLEGGKEQGTSGKSSLWAEAKVTWNGQKNELAELVKLTDPGGEHSGGLELDFKCMQDPVVQKSDCVRLKFKNSTDWPGFSVPADKNRPMLAGQATLAEVEKLAAKVAASVPPVHSAQAPTGSAQAVRSVQLPVTSGQAPGRSAPTPEARWSPPPSIASAPAAASAAASQRQASPGASLPDLASGAQVTVAGKHKVPWGGSISIGDADARAAASGVCQVAVEHTIRNLGPAASAASGRRWVIEGQAEGLVAQVPAIDSGGAQTRVDTLPLRPGLNKLRLALDNLEQVTELNEGNNVYTLAVTVSGSCGGAPLPATRAAGGPGDLRWSPAQRATGAGAAPQSAPPGSRLQQPAMR